MLLIKNYKLKKLSLYSVQKYYHGLQSNHKTNKIYLSENNKLKKIKKYKNIYHVENRFLLKLREKTLITKYV